MNYLHIEVLTPLHIGSGRTLRSNTEFLKFDDVVSVIDDHKILNIIGEENIQNWVDIISKGGDLLDYLKKRSPSKTIAPQQTDKRLLPIVGKYLKPDNGLREHIFSGNGQPILPGSSLKGAIRTAVVNGLLVKQPFIANGALKSKVVGQTWKGDRTVKYGKFEPQLMGKDPNHDSFRLVRIGDVHFNQTVCLLAQTLNQKLNGLEIKEMVNQLVECIPVGSESLSGVSIPADLLKEINKRPLIANGMKANNEINDWDKIFKHINHFTKRQVDSELKKYNSASLPREALSYPEKLKEISGQIAKLTDTECIIRVGFGTGYLNMTGGWPIEQWQKTLTPIQYQTEMEDLGTAVRKNSRYNSFALPKSRKIISGGVPMGFLKLTLWSAEQAEEWRSEATLRQAELVKQQTQAADEARVKAEQEAEAARLAAEAKKIEEERKAEAARLKAEQEAEVARIAAEEAKKPKLFEGKLKVGAEFDAEIVVSGKPNKMKIYVVGHELDQIPMIGYASAEPVGKIVIVTVNILGKDGKVKEVRYKKFK